VEEVVKLLYPLTMVKLGRFYTPIKVDALETLASVPTLQARTRLSRFTYLKIQDPEMLYFPGKFSFVYYYIQMKIVEISIV
jgi:hypothetical protein